MSSDLGREVRAELGDLAQLLDEFRPLVEKAGTGPPTLYEVSALGTMLHSFYNGVENVFKRISVQYALPADKSPHWHVELLESVQRPAPGRPQVISNALSQRLRLFLGFRHLMRSIYPQRLQWDGSRTLYSRSRIPSRFCDPRLRTSSAVPATLDP